MSEPSTTHGQDGHKNTILLFFAALHLALEAYQFHTRPPTPVAARDPPYVDINCLHNIQEHAVQHLRSVLESLNSPPQSLVDQVNDLPVEISMLFVRFFAAEDPAATPEACQKLSKDVMGRIQVVAQAVLRVQGEEQAGADAQAAEPATPN